MEKLHRKLASARGEIPADLVFKNATIVNVLSGEYHEGDVAVTDGTIVGIGRYTGLESVDLTGKYLMPAFIDAHIHIESSMLTVEQFARAVVPKGTSGCVVDPHEFANVLGTEGITALLNYSQGIPLDLFVMISSCVPATGFETSAVKITADQIYLYSRHKRSPGVAEMMNFPGVYLGNLPELEKIAAAEGKRVDGHSPGLSGHSLNAYILAGIESDHECTTIAEAREKLQRGMHILLREGTAERNLLELLPLVTPENAVNVSFATDDKHPADLEDEGHIDHHIREAIRFGIHPITAIQMGSINTARFYRLKGHGAIAPGYHANFVVCSDLHDMHAEIVYHNGDLVAKNGTPMFTTDNIPGTPAVKNSMHVAPFSRDSFTVHSRSNRNIRVIDIVPGQIITKSSVEAPLVENDNIISDTKRDILKLVVIERHRASGNIGIGFVRGFNLKRGALASTVAHDAHNIVIVGTNDVDIYFTALELIRMNGGLCISENAHRIEALSLPVAGLVSDQPLQYVRKKIDALTTAAHSLGCTLPDPFMTLSFLSLSPVPALKLTDQGLIDSEKFERTSLFVNAE